jgi:hypothetical protein
MKAIRNKVFVLLCCNPTLDGEEGIDGCFKTVITEFLKTSSEILG